MANLACANAIMLYPHQYHHNTLSSGIIGGIGAERAVAMSTNNIVRRIRLFEAEVAPQPPPNIALKP